MLGIALGSFAQGFATGVDMRQRLDATRKQNKLDKGLEQAAVSGEAEFNADKAAGNVEGDFEQNYSQYVIPKVAHQYAIAGQPEMAVKWNEWAESANAKKGSKLFASGLGKLQTGDVQAGIDDMIKAANLSGYGPDGKMTAAEYYDEEAGAVTGYKFTFTGKDGNEHTKNVATADVAQFLAGVANPQSAFELDQSSKAAEGKADLEVKTHVRKKAAEAALGVGPGAMTQAQYQNAIQEERKNIEDRALTDPEMADITSEEKEQMAKEAVDARLGKGGGAAAGPTVTVDPETGEQVQPGGAETPATDSAAPPAPEEAVPTDQDLGVDTSVPTSSISPPPEQAPAAPSANGVTAPTPAAATSAPQGNTQAYVSEAAQMMKQGAPAQKIAQKLIQAGVPVEQWPQDLRLAASNSQLGVRP